MERNPLAIFGSLFVSWTGTLGTVFFENINTLMALACGAASLIASLYAIALSRERLKLLERHSPVKDRSRNKLDHLSIILLALVPITLLIGCAGVATKTDRAWFRVTTNQVPHVVAVTNQPAPMPVVAALTNAATGKAEIVTNYIALPPVVRLVTNYVPQEELIADPAVEASVRDAGGAIGSFWGFGGVSAALAGGLYHMVMQFRNRRINSALIQGIETAREVIKTTPQGQQLEAQYIHWLQENQKEANVINAVAKLVDKTADNESAQYAAAFLAEELQKQNQPPQP